MSPVPLGTRLTPPQLFAVLEGVLDALVVTDPAGQVAYMNSAALQLYDVEGPAGATTDGFDLRAHVLGAFQASTLAGAPVAEADHPLTRALRGEAYKDVALLMKRAGEENPRVHVFSGSRIETDPPLGVLTIRDETDRWRAERRYRVAFEADPAPSVIARLADTHILEANEGMAELTGLAKEALRERSLVDLRPLHQSDLKEVAERLRTGERVHKVKRLLLSADGRELPVLLSARAIEVEGQSCGIFTFIDTSELVTARREQRETQELLSATLTEHAEERAAMDLLATTDPLTDIANRRGLNARLSEELARGERYDDTFSILLLDLDHFKGVNDTFGHEVGDAVLRDFARLLQEECREPDLAGRWGGEEFMMILPQSDQAAAEDVASRVRRRVESAVFAGGVHLTVSIGVASLEARDSAGDLFAKADRALYAAKRRGRNRVEVGSVARRDELGTLPESS